MRRDREHGIEIPFFALLCFPLLLCAVAGCLMNTTQKRENNKRETGVATRLSVDESIVVF